MMNFLKKPVSFRLSCVIGLCAALLAGIAVMALRHFAIFKPQAPAQKTAVELAREQAPNGSAPWWEVETNPWNIADFVPPVDPPKELPLLEVENWRLVYKEFEVDRAVAFRKYRNKKIVVPANWLQHSPLTIVEFGRHALWIEMGQYPPDGQGPIDGPRFRALISGHGVVCRLSEEGEKTYLATQGTNLGLFAKLEMVGTVDGTAEFSEGRFFLNVKECYFIPNGLFRMGE